MKDENIKLLLGYLFIIVATIIMLAVCSCQTSSSTEQTIDYRHFARLTERMDSMMRSTATWQQQIYEKQTSLVDSFKHSEVRDTSRTIFLGEKGDTIKETVVIRKFIEREHSTQESTQEYWKERFEKTDSLLRVAISRQEETDSLLHVHEKTTVVEKQAPLYKRILDRIGMLVLCLIGGLLAVIAIRKRIFR